MTLTEVRNSWSYRGVVTRGISGLIGARDRTAMRGTRGRFTGHRGAVMRSCHRGKTAHEQTDHDGEKPATKLGVRAPREGVKLRRAI